MSPTFGYARVSTQDQNLDRQLEALKAHNCDDIYQEKISGKNADRPQLKELLKHLRKDDTLIITEMSRLARSTRDLLNITSDLQDKGVNLVFLKEQIDTKSPTGKLLFTVLASISEFERETIKERQKEGIAIAKAKGVYKGRPYKQLPENKDSIVADWKAGKLTAVKASELLGISRASLYRLFK